MRCKTLAILLIAGVFLAFPGLVLANLSITPALVETELTKGRARGAFVVTNLADVPVRYRIQSSHFTFTETGTLQLVQPDENSLAEWLKFNPKELRLPPKSRQRVRFVIVPRGKLKNQAYWAAMELESLDTTITTRSDDQGRDMAVEMVPSILVPIFASNGNVSYDYDLVDSAVVDGPNGKLITTTVRNVGGGHLLLAGAFTIFDAAGEVVTKGSFGRDYILPKKQRVMTGAIMDELPAGPYTVRIRFNNPDGEAKAVDIKYAH